MIELIVKLSLLIGLPVGVVVVWKKRSHAYWSSLFFGFGAFAINYLVRIPLSQALNQVDPRFLTTLPPALAGVIGGWFPIILFALVLGLFREGIRWLMFRYVATNVRLWRDGVMFGIGYSSIAMLYRLGNGFSELATDIDLLQNSLVETMTALNDMFEFGWFRILVWAWRLGVVSMVFHVGMSLVVLFSVQKRDVRLLLISVVLYIVYLTAPAVMLQHSPDLQVVGIGRPWSVTINVELGRFLAVLPFLWLIFRLRPYFPTR